ncbi:hypothetical protein C8R47DRAFT_1210936 [Mycena vitilis]|nr:hypothetical protein C8R47DRAFT_1210936 [Mycena vitilis]
MLPCGRARVDPPAPYKTQDTSAVHTRESMHSAGVMRMRGVLVRHSTNTSRLTRSPLESARIARTPTGPPADFVPVAVDAATFVRYLASSRSSNIDPLRLYLHLRWRKVTGDGAPHTSVQLRASFAGALKSQTQRTSAAVTARAPFANAHAPRAPSAEVHPAPLRLSYAARLPPPAPSYQKREAMRGCGGLQVMQTVLPVPASPFTCLQLPPISARPPHIPTASPCVRRRYARAALESRSTRSATALGVYERSVSQTPFASFTAIERTDGHPHPLPTPLTERDTHRGCTSPPPTRRLVTIKCKDVAVPARLSAIRAPAHRHSRPAFDIYASRRHRIHVPQHERTSPPPLRVFALALCVLHAPAGCSDARPASSPPSASPRCPPAHRRPRAAFDIRTNDGTTTAPHRRAAAHRQARISRHIASLHRVFAARRPSPPRTPPPSAACVPGHGGRRRHGIAAEYEDTYSRAASPFTRAPHVRHAHLHLRHPTHAPLSLPHPIVLHPLENKGTHRSDHRRSASRCRD